MGSYDVVSAGRAFPECPRWHEGRLWFSDIYAGQVARLDGRLLIADALAAREGALLRLGV